MIKRSASNNTPARNQRSTGQMRKLILVRPGNYSPPQDSFLPKEEKNVINADWLICPYETTQGLGATHIARPNKNTGNRNEIEL